MNERNYDEWDEGLEIDFKKIIISLKKGLKWIIITPTIFCIIAIVFAFFIAKPVFTSEAKFLLTSKEQSESSLLQLANQFGFSIPSNSESATYLTYETLPEIIRSRSISNSILFNKFTSEKYDQPTYFFNMLFPPGVIAESDSSQLIEIGQNIIKEKVVSIYAINNSPLLRLNVNTIDPNLSYQIANHLIEELKLLQLELQHRDIDNEKKFVIERLSEIEQELIIAEIKLKNFREQNLQIGISPTLQLEQERLNRNIEIQTGLYLSLKQQLEKIKIDENKDFTSIKVIDEPNIPYNRSKPKRKLIVIIAGFLGIILGSAIAIIKEK